ncbi:MAG: 50S ribosomal protein L10 [Chloroflexaceae bacterium]
MPTERKVATVEYLTEKLSRMQLAIITDYRGLTVAEMAELRGKLRESGAELIVAKNTLIRLAARQSGHEQMESLLEGPTALTLAYDDVARVAKTLNDYLKDTPKVSIRGGVLGQSFLPADGLEQVTKLPSREQVLAEIVGGIQSPISGVVNVINAPLTGVVGIVDAVVSDVMNVLQARINQMQSGS